MRCLRLVGALKLQVSLGEYRLFYRALLHKRPIILRRLLIVATPYLYWKPSFGICVMQVSTDRGGTSHKEAQLYTKRPDDWWGEKSPDGRNTHLWKEPYLCLACFAKEPCKLGTWMLSGARSRCSSVLTVSACMCVCVCVCVRSEEHTSELQSR